MPHEAAPRARVVRERGVRADAGVPVSERAERSSFSPKRETAGRISMFCSLVQIGQFWSRRLWRQNEGMGELGDDYMTARPRAAKNCLGKETGGPRSIWAPRRVREVGAQF